MLGGSSVYRRCGTAPLGRSGRGRAARPSHVRNPRRRGPWHRPRPFRGALANTRADGAAARAPVRSRPFPERRARVARDFSSNPEGLLQRIHPMGGRIFAIAMNTYREAVRGRVLHALLAFALATTGYSLVIATLSFTKSRAWSPTSAPRRCRSTSLSWPSSSARHRFTARSNTRRSSPFSHALFAGTNT